MSPLKLSERVNLLKPSPTMEISAKAGELKGKGHDVISLAAGEPDFSTPEPIQTAATEAMAKGLTRYTPASGFLALREVVAEKVSQESDLPTSPDDVIVTCGAKHALYLALQCLAEAGQSVLLPTPAWVSYGAQIELSGANIFPLPLFEEDGFRANVDRWKGMAIPSNAKGIILNSPNNPTGIAYTKEDLVRIVGWAMQRNLWIIADEVYEKILYDGMRHTSVASLGPEVRNCTITISSVSKTYSMTGWRVGWAIGPKEVIKKMTALQSQSTSNVTSFAQWATMTALKLPNEVIQNMVAAFDRRRGYCCERLDSLKPALSYVKPNGAFYFFVNMSPWLRGQGLTDVDFCKKLLAEQYVGVVPGSAFGKENYIRISYATSDENLKKAFDRLETFLN